MFEYPLIAVLLLLIGFGLPVPEESVLLIAAFLVATGSSAGAMLAVSVLAIAGADTVRYLRGRLESVRFRKFRPGKHFIASVGFFAIFMGRFFVGSRGVLQFMAGAMQMRRWPFHLASVLSAFCLSSLILLAGKWLYELIAAVFPLAVAGVWLVLVLLVTGVLMMLATRSQMALLKESQQNQ